MTTETTDSHEPETLDRIVIRFAGDSGDGMQLTGDRFTDVSAAFGNDLATLPNFPAEIRAPAGTIAGVSSFQVHISDHDIVTPGDVPNVLVAMNPAALKANIGDLPVGGTLIVNEDAFGERNLAKVGYESNPVEDGSLSAYKIIQVPMTSITLEACKELGVKPRDAERSKNLFALGLISWMYTRPSKQTIDWIEQKFAAKPMVRDANIAAYKAGYHFGETAELFDHPFEIAPAVDLAPGRYRNINGNLATAYGLIAASQTSKLPMVYASYPITPASDILHELSNRKNFGIRTLQAEDEIAAVGVAIGAAFAGALGVTATSGPGLDLKSEGIGLADQPRASAHHRRRATRRPVDRTADEDRAERPHARDVRASRRSALAGRVRIVAEPLFRRCVRSGAHRGEIPYAGDPAHRRLPGQRLRTLAPARRRRAGRPRRCTSPTRPTTATSSGRTCAIPRRSRDRGRFPARPACSIGSAVSRSRTAPATSTTTRRITTSWCGSAPRRSPASPTTFRRCRSTARTAPSVLVLGWGSTWGSITAGVRRVRGAREAGRARAAHPPQPVPRESR